MASLGLCESLFLDYAIKQLPSIDELHDQVYFLLSLNNIKQLNNIGMPDLLEYEYLPVNPMSISLFYNPINLEYLDRDLPPSYDMNSQLYLPKSALANSFPCNIKCW